MEYKHYAFKASILFTLFLIYSCEIPSYIKICSRNDPQIEKCINDSIYSLIPYLKVGISELDVPPLEPLPLGSLQLNRGPRSAKIEANMTNLNIWGASTFSILDLKVNIPKNLFKFRVRVPHLYFEGNYKLNMTILAIDLRGTGPFSGNITDYTFDCSMKGHKIEHNGEEYLKFDKMKLKINVGKGGLYFQNLFNGNEVLEKATNDVINDNVELFLDEIKPNLQNALSDKFTEISNKITLKFSYKELFPEI